MIVIPLLIYSSLSFTIFHLSRWLFPRERVKGWEFLIHAVVYLTWLAVFSIRLSRKGMGNLLLEPMLLSLAPPVYFVAGKCINGEQQGAIKIGLMALVGAAVFLAGWFAPHWGDWP